LFQFYFSFILHVRAALETKPTLLHSDMDSLVFFPMNSKHVNLNDHFMLNSVFFTPVR